MNVSAKISSKASVFIGLATDAISAPHQSHSDDKHLVALGRNELCNKCSNDELYNRALAIRSIIE